MCEHCKLWEGAVFETHAAHQRGGAYNIVHVRVHVFLCVCVYVYTKKDLGLVIGDCLEISSMVCLPCY